MAELISGIFQEKLVPELRTNFINLILKGNKTIENPEEIADEFNHFFVNVGVSSTFINFNEAIGILGKNSPIPPASFSFKPINLTS